MYLQAKQKAVEAKEKAVEAKEVSFLSVTMFRGVTLHVL